MEIGLMMDTKPADREEHHYERGEVVAPRGLPVISVRSGNAAPARRQAPPKRPPALLHALWQGPPAIQGLPPVRSLVSAARAARRRRR